MSGQPRRPAPQPGQFVFRGSADFFMYQFKIVPCTVPISHDWALCPYVHHNEKARRRNPAVYSYAAIPCPVDRKGTNCPSGDACPYSHHVYEYWLHPDRFRTQMCLEGPNCKRTLCFFAHNQEEMRQPLPAAAPLVQQLAAPPPPPPLQPLQAPGCLPRGAALVPATAGPDLLALQLQQLSMAETPPWAVAPLPQHPLQQLPPQQRLLPPPQLPSPPPPRLHQHAASAVPQQRQQEQEQLQEQDQQQQWRRNAASQPSPLLHYYAPHLPPRAPPH